MRPTAMVGTNVVRLVLAIFGTLLLIGGVAVGTLGDGAVVGALWMTVSGIVLLVVAAIETLRYGSGPGGGESTQPDPRFKATGEVFVDPTTHIRMRVYLDGRTGERKYVADG